MGAGRRPAGSPSASFPTAVATTAWAGPAAGLSSAPKWGTDTPEVTGRAGLPGNVLRRQTQTQTYRDPDAGQGVARGRAAPLRAHPRRACAAPAPFLPRPALLTGTSGRSRSPGASAQGSRKKATNFKDFFSPTLVGNYYFG